MASQPTIVTGRRRQHELLRSWSGWPLTSILIDPAEVAHAREAGWSGTHHHDPETGERIVGTAGGLGFGVDGGWHNPVEVVPWTEVEAIARAVLDEVRQQLVEFRARWRDHQVAYPRFVASADAIGCGPIVPGQPLTPRQEAYACEHEAFEAGGVLPAWEQKRAVLDAERLGLHARALSVDVDSEAGDLLDLLDGRPEGRRQRGAAGHRGRGRAALVDGSAGAATALTRHYPCGAGSGIVEPDRATHGRSGPMIASKPVRLLSLAIVALVALAGVRGIVGGTRSSGDLFEDAGADPVAAGKRIPGVVAYVVDGDTVKVTTPNGRDVRVRLLGIIH